MDDKELKRLVRNQRLRKIKLEFKYHWRFIRKKQVPRKIRFKYLFLEAIFRRCGGKGKMCGGGWAYFSSINTAYHDELSNYQFCCKDCHKQINAYYDELWAEYYSGRI